MKQENSKSLFAVLSVMMLISACGKNMSLKADASKLANLDQSVVPGQIDATKVSQKDSNQEESVLSEQSLKKSEYLSSFSEYDLKELKIGLESISEKKRALVQVPPKNSVKEVLKLELIFEEAEIADRTKVSICIIEKDCRPLPASVELKTGQKVQIDLLETFGMKGKPVKAVMDWIDSNSTLFANPGYRKFRFTFEGISKMKGGRLNMQLITNSELPKDFAIAPTCYVHGDEDLREQGADADPSTVTCETDAS